MGRVFVVRVLRLADLCVRVEDREYVWEELHRIGKILHDRIELLLLIHNPLPSQ